MIHIQDIKMFGGPQRTRLNIPMLTLQGPGITALVGHNGAGKSTLLNAIAGYEKPHAGKVLYEGKDTFIEFELCKKKTWSNLFTRHGK